jgi:hypothetical protein
VSSGEDKSGNDFDVVLVHGKTADGNGACVLRARPGRVEAGEVRALESGRPLAPGGQVVQLSPRGGSASNLYDVKVEYEVPGGRASEASEAPSGPAQVATPAYRDSWDRTFGSRGGSSMAN